jgi:DNA-binding MarR family transcriptional regulator
MSTATVPAIIAPASLEDLGVRRSLLEDLALKILYLSGEISLQQLAEQMCLQPSLTTELFNRLRKEQLVEVTGTPGRPRLPSLNT